MGSIAFDFIIGASILLIPLIILIFVIAIDLKSKERKLDEEIFELDELLTLTKSGNLERDNERIMNMFQQIKAKNNDIGGTPEEIYDCNYALATEKVMKIRKEEMVVLHEKIETFQKGSNIFIAVTIGLLSILPLIYIWVTNRIRLFK